MPPDQPSPESRELREALATFLPAILVALVLNWALATQFGMEPRRALLASIGAGIVLALILQRVVHGRGDRR